MKIKSKDLNSQLEKLKKPDNLSWKAQIFDLTERLDSEKFSELLLKKSDSLIFHDELASQLKELFKIRNPKKKLSSEEQEKLYKNWLTNNDHSTYGLYVYYPWSEKIVHIVSEAEFIELRTSRNKYKITEEEQKRLSNKTIGVIGLSVGQSVAVTMAIERVFGTIRLADFDHLEMTNLNRIRAGVDAIGLPKTVLVAREIMEIDPFLKLELFNYGVDKENIGEFLGSGASKLDVLVEECDSLDIKIIARLEARKRQIPVLMDTSDRGMIDIERFDLEPEREILHGKIKVENPDKLKTLTYEEKVPFILEMVGAENMSERMKASMLEVEQSLSSWPQLAGDVAMGGAICTELVKEVLLGRELKSGRFYIDPLEFINGKKEKKTEGDEEVPEVNVRWELMQAKLEYGDEVPDNVLEELLTAAIQSPSGGNLQPWRFKPSNKVIHIFLDPGSIEFVGDYKRSVSMIQVGGLIENVRLKAARYGYKLVEHINPNGEESYLAASLTFTKNKGEDHNLEPYIATRHTNRNIEKVQPLPAAIFDDLEELKEALAPGGINLQLIREREKLDKIGDFVAAADVQRLIDKEAHAGFYSEIRWGDKEARQTGDGIDIETVDISKAELAGFSIARNWRAVEVLGKMNLGSAFGRLSKKQVSHASAVVHISGRDFNPHCFVEGGKAMERLWLLAEKHQLGFQPLLSTCLFYNQYRNGGADLMPENMRNALRDMHADYVDIFENMKNNKTELFLARLFVPVRPVKRSYRKSRTELMID